MRAQLSLGSPVAAARPGGWVAVYLDKGRLDKFQGQQAAIAHLERSSVFGENCVRLAAFAMKVAHVNAAKRISCQLLKNFIPCGDRPLSASVLLGLTRPLPPLHGTIPSVAAPHPTAQAARSENF